MDFKNDQIEVNELPVFKASTPDKLAARFARIRLGVLLIFYCVLMLLVFLPLQLVPEVSTFTFSLRGLGFGVMVLLAACLLAAYVFAYTRSIHYAVREHDIILGSGVFWKKEVIQPLNRVQHVELTRGPIDKYYELANLRLFSAGTGLSTFRIPGLEDPTAARIKQYVLDYREIGVAELKEVSD